MSNTFFDSAVLSVPKQSYFFQKSNYQRSNFCIASDAAPGKAQSKSTHTHAPFYILPNSIQEAFQRISGE